MTMDERSPTTDRMSRSEAKRRFDDLIDAVVAGTSRVIVERDGERAVAIVSANDLERLLMFEEQRAAQFAILDEIGEVFADVSEEELEREVVKAVAEARAEIQAVRHYNGDR
jgi:prevent-host-death family protein